MLNYNEFLEFQNVVKLIPILNKKGVDVSVSFTTKGNITVVFVDNKEFAWDSDTASQETKDRFYKKIEELLEK